MSCLCIGIDKEAFYSSFETWDDSLKDWAIETISNNI